MENKKISVIITLYNTEKLIKRCIESISAQTYDNLEIIVVDDGSTDKSVDIVKELSLKDDRIKLVSHKENKGLYHARITGVDHADGDYIGFVDSDDYISCDYFESLLQGAVEADADITVGKIVHEDDIGYRFIHNLYHFYEFKPLEGKDIVSAYWQQEGRCFIWHTVWNKLYTRRIWEQALPHLKKQSKHLIMTEDFLFSSVLFNYAKKLSFVEYGTYYYYQHSDASTSLAGGKKKYEKNISDLKTAFDFVEEFVNSEHYRIDAKEQFEKWRTLYRKFWMENVENSQLKPNEKAQLQFLVDRALPGDEKKVRDSSYFYTVTSKVDERYNGIVNKIVSDDVKAVSFDIFDTAVVRPFYRPVDLFYVIDKEADGILRKSRASFSDMRIQAEREVRREQLYCDKPKKEDVTLDDIYEYMKENWSLEEETVQKLRQLETEAEVKFCTARKSVYNLYKRAISSGKKVFFTTDMYLPKETITAILKKNRYTEYDGLLISCESNLSKRTGKLYVELLEAAGCKAEEILHLGDTWDSDVIKACENGIDGIFYPKTMDCIQYNIPDIHSTHSCCAYTEPTGTIMNFEKGIEFMGTRTALALAANRIYDNPFIPYNKWTEMNCSPQFLGYYALGMHLLGFTKWLTESAIKKEYDTLAFISRDGYLPMAAYDIYKKYYNNTPKAEYIYTSRKAAFACAITEVADMYLLYDNINAEHLSVEGFLEMLGPVLGTIGDDVWKKNGIKTDKPIGDYSSFCRVARIAFEQGYDKEKARTYNQQVAAYFENVLFGKSAVVDVGYSGRTQEMIHLLTGKSVDAYYVHSNDDKCKKRERRYHFDVMNFYEYTPSITGGVRELLFSQYAPSCIGYDIAGGKAEPVFEPFTENYCESYFIEQVQGYALKFVEDFCNYFGEYLDIMDMRNNDVSHPYEFFLSTLTEADGKMFECFRFEDDMWAGNTFSLEQYWRDSIRYHKLTPFYNMDYDEAAATVINGNEAYQKYVQSGMEEKSLVSKGLFWLSQDPKFFAKRLKEHIKKD